MLVGRGTPGKVAPGEISRRVRSIGVGCESRQAGGGQASFEPVIMLNNPGGPGLAMSVVGQETSYISQSTTDPNEYLTPGCLARAASLLTAETVSMERMSHAPLRL